MDYDYIHQKLLELECPFTWDLTEYKVDKINWNLGHDEDFVPELTFTRFLMTTYANILKVNYVEADEKLREAEKVILELESPKTEVARHVLDSTKANFLAKIGKFDEIEKILKDIKNIKDEIYLSPLNELKACVWTHCNIYISTTNIAIKFAKLAIENDSNVATAHYLLAKNLRTVRRLISVFKCPENEEIYHFKKAYDLSKNPQFGLFVAQVLKENHNRHEAYNKFIEICEMDIKSPSLQMRLALAFIQMNNFGLAQKCLDYVESISPEDSMFLHYKGLYLMKRKKYEEASKYLLKAAKDLNYAAEISYAKCMRKLGKRFDFTGNFLKMLETYWESENLRKREMLLHTAFSYFYIKRDIREAIKYFLRAFEIETEDDSLEKYHDIFSDKTVNVYTFLKKELLPKVKTYRQSKLIALSDETISATEKLNEFCEKYKSRCDVLQNEMHKLSL